MAENINLKIEIDDRPWWKKDVDRIAKESKVLAIKGIELGIQNRIIKNV